MSRTRYGKTILLAGLVYLSGWAITNFVFDSDLANIYWTACYLGFCAGCVVASRTAFNDGLDANKPELEALREMREALEQGAVIATVRVIDHASGGDDERRGNAPYN